MNLAEYYRNHPKRSLLLIVVAAVLIGLMIDVTAEGIESHNERVLDAQHTEESVRNEARRCADRTNEGPGLRVHGAVHPGSPPPCLRETYVSTIMMTVELSGSDRRNWNYPNG